MSIRQHFGEVCRQTRLHLDLTQAAVGAAAGLTRGYVGKVERGEANVTIDQLERISDALGLRTELVTTAPVFLAAVRTHDLVHGRCADAVSRRLIRAGWKVARELNVSGGGVHGWIDLLAYQPDTRTLLIIEIKTRLDDLGGTQRQVGWYERHALAAARRLGWIPIRTATWVVGLASDEVESALVNLRSTVDEWLPGRAGNMLDVARDGARPVHHAVAPVDPRSKRRDWLIRTRLDGRRSPAPYRHYADAARRLSA